MILLSYFVKKVLRLLSFINLFDYVVIISGGGGAQNHSLSNYRYACSKYKNRKVYFVACYRSADYLYIYSLKGFFISHFSRMIIADSSLPYSINLSNKLVYQTWHGIPLKNLGLEDKFLMSKLKSYQVKAMLQQWKDTDYVFCPVLSMENALKKAFEISNSSVLKKNTPYINEIISRRSCKLGSPDKPSILYLPTYRDYQSDRISWDLLCCKEFVDYVVLNNIVIYYKYHPLDCFYQSSDLLGKNFVKIEGEYFEVLSNVDVLITDYSSTYFDAKISGVESLIYAPDYKLFNAERGLDDLCFYDSEINNKDVDSLFEKISLFLR